MGFSLPRPRQLWRQVHWFIGITAGTLLMVIGLSGAILSFREEVTDWLNPGGRHVEVLEQAALTPPQLLAAMQRDGPHREVGTLAVFSAPGAAARVIFAPPRGQRRGEMIYLNPYTGQALPPLRGSAFFETMDSLHRWLLLPRESGRWATGVLALALLVLAGSGLYVRWPRQWRDGRAWFAIAPNLKGRALLSRWHVVLGTCMLPIYLLSSVTGLYWAFDTVRDQLDSWLGAPQRAAAAAGKAGKPSKPAPVDAGIASAWPVFEQRARTTGGWSEAIIRVSGGSVLFTWLDAHPAHERARNRMTLSLPQAQVLVDERHAAKPAGARLLAAIYPLHMGTYFGLPGRVVMMLGALALPVFGVTGWWLYVDRRSKRRKPVQAMVRPA
jgi:sulfite reductase (NADPH) flavoprotein alpha-component